MIANVTGGLSSLLNIVPTAGKLTLIPLIKESPVPIPGGPPYVFMFNPEQYSESETQHFNDDQAIGTSGSQSRYSHTEAKVYNFELLIDGTGASGDKREIMAEITALKLITGFNGAQHTSRPLIVAWGSLISTCVVTRMNIMFTLFRANGIPLRAKVSIQFRETRPITQILLEMALLSPDLTHHRIVQEGEKLPILCYQVYETPQYYLEVARANGLTNFRRLRAGMELYFLPVQQ